MKDKRLLIDKVLSECCDYFGVTWTDLHDEAFCVQHKLGHWLYIWYNEDDDILDCEIKGTKVSFIIENEQDIQLITKSLYDIRLQYISIPIFFNNVLLSDKESSVYLLNKLNISVVKYLNKKDDYIRLGDFLYPIDYSNLNINSKLITELKIILSFMISAKDIIKNNLIYFYIERIYNIWEIKFR